MKDTPPHLKALEEMERNCIVGLVEVLCREDLEGRIGKPLKELSRAEADEWIDRLTPEGRE